MKVRIWDGNKMWLPSVETVVSFVLDLSGRMHRAEGLFLLDMPSVEGSKSLLSTGLFDKNKKEIFQGDVIRYTYKEEIWVANVIWNQEIAGFSLGGLERTWADHIDSHNCKYMEVIGNIYENPDMKGPYCQKCGKTTDKEIHKNPMYVGLTCSDCLDKWRQICDILEY